MGLKSTLSGISSKGQGLLGVLTVVAGFYMMWGSLAGGAKDKSTLSKAASEAVEIDANLPSTKHIGELVVASAMLKATEPLEEDFIKTDDVVVLYRRVLMYQWTERRSSNEGGAIEYYPAWVEGQIDFLAFSEPLGHENPVLKYDSKLFKPEVISFGGFDGSEIVGAVTKFPQYPISTELLKDSTYTLHEGGIYISRGGNPSAPAIGDMKVFYQGLVKGYYTIAARQVDEVTLVGKGGADEIVLKPGKLTAEELFTEIGSESKNTYSGLLYLGGIVFFLGLVSTLIQVCPGLDLRPKIDLQGKPAIVVAAFGVTIIAMIVFSIMGLVS